MEGGTVVGFDDLGALDKVASMLAEGLQLRLELLELGIPRHEAALLLRSAPSSSSSSSSYSCSCWWDLGNARR